MCQGEDTMTRHRLIFLKESAGSALSVKLKMLGGEHLNDTVIHPVHAVDYHSSTLCTPFMLTAAGSDLSTILNTLSALLWVQMYDVSASCAGAIHSAIYPLAFSLHPVLHQCQALNVQLPTLCCVKFAICTLCTFVSHMACMVSLHCTPTLTFGLHLNIVACTTHQHQCLHYTPTWQSLHYTPMLQNLHCTPMCCCIVGRSCSIVGRSCNAHFANTNIFN